PRVEAMARRLRLLPPARNETPTGYAKPGFAELAFAVDDLHRHRRRDVESPRKRLAVRRPEVPGTLDRCAVRGYVAAAHPYLAQPSSRRSIPTAVNANSASPG